MDVEQFKSSELMQTVDQVRDLKDKVQFRSIVKAPFVINGAFTIDTINDYTNDNNHVADEFTFRYFSPRNTNQKLI